MGDEVPEVTFLDLAGSPTPSVVDRTGRIVYLASEHRPAELERALERALQPQPE